MYLTDGWAELSELSVECGRRWEGTQLQAQGGRGGGSGYVSCMQI
jgi:hypothetical protein